MAALCLPLPARSAEPIRGVWLTNVDSEVLLTRQGIDRAVDHCASVGINTIFVVTWNKAMTTYPSAVVKQVTSREIDTLYTGRDPLKELIESAHRKGIRVVAWFEFGFASSFKQNGGTLLQARPHWSSRNAEGKLVTKNGFEWLNAFHPEVQDFMLAMVLEVVQKYDIDGVQGDDRLPAMPSEGGYDPYTVARYKSEHGGAAPPKDHKDPAWVQWRADILNAFMKRMYSEVKALKPQVSVVMAPSVYPWSKEDYLQDWPTWLRNGWVDHVIPQIYRYKLEQYVTTLDEIRSSQIAKEEMDRFTPGLLLKVGEYHPSPELLSAMIREHRKRGIEGEVYFFYEGLKYYPEFFRNVYKERPGTSSTIN
ncbi:MAG: family 10 glycosylhydrolase [Bacteroidetes bacterium]|nr:family 10 glycosylhydrolase [Bacteroidota bacterium]